MLQVSVKVLQGCSVLKVHCCMSFIAVAQAEGGLVLNISWWVGRWPYSFSVLKHAYNHKTKIVQELSKQTFFQKLPPIQYICKVLKSCLFMKMSPFLFLCPWAMPRMLYFSHGIPFPVGTPDTISSSRSVVVWLSRSEVIKKNFR